MNSWEWPLLFCWAFAGLALWFMRQARRHALSAAKSLADAKRLVGNLWNQSDGR